VSWIKPTQDKIIIADFCESDNEPFATTMDEGFLDEQSGCHFL
jgi:hypothetical protein